MRTMRVVPGACDAEVGWLTRHSCCDLNRPRAWLPRARGLACMEVHAFAPGDQGQPGVEMVFTCMV